MSFLMKSNFFADEYDSGTGILLRTCEENVAVNKCEGQCASSIYPSARNALGFHKVDTITFYILPNCIKCTFRIETGTSILSIRVRNSFTVCQCFDLENVKSSK